MRLLAPLFTFLAAAATIVSVMVQLWWSKPTPTPQDWMPDKPPKASPWMITAAKWWLILVVVGGTAIFLIVVVFLLMSLSA